MLGDSDCWKHFDCKVFDRSTYSILCYNLDICNKMLPVGCSTALPIKMDFVQFSKFVAQYSVKFWLHFNHKYL